MSNSDVDLDHLHSIKGKHPKSKMTSKTLEVSTASAEVPSTSQDLETLGEMTVGSGNEIRTYSLPQNKLLTEPNEVFKVQEESIFDPEIIDLDSEHSKDSPSLVPEPFTENDSLKPQETKSSSVIKRFVIILFYYNP